MYKVRLFMKTIGFIGCGNMAQPIIRNVAEKNVFGRENIYVYETGVIKIEFKFKDEYQDLIMFLKKHNYVI